MISFNTILKIIVFCSMILPSVLSGAQDQSKPLLTFAPISTAASLSPELILALGNSVLQTSQLTLHVMQTTQTESKQREAALIQLTQEIDARLTNREKRAAALESHVANLAQQHADQLTAIAARLAAVDAQLEAQKQHNKEFEDKLKNHEASLIRMQGCISKATAQIIDLKLREQQQHGAAQSNSAHASSASATAILPMPYMPFQPPAPAHHSFMMGSAPQPPQFLLVHHPLPPLPLPTGIPLYHPLQQPPPPAPAKPPSIPSLVLPPPAATTTITAPNSRKKMNS